MPDLLEQAVDRAIATLQASAAHTVTYDRGGTEVEIAATAHWREFPDKRFDPNLGTFVAIGKIRSREFLFQAADLVLDGATITPRKGDKVKEVTGSTRYTFEIMEIANEQHYRWEDPYRKMVRVHSKQVDAEAV